MFKKKVPNLYPITHSSSQLFWTEQPPRSGPLGDPLCLQGPPADTLLNPRPAGSVLARLKYYLAQASERHSQTTYGPSPSGPPLPGSPEVSQHWQAPSTSPILSRT